MTDFIHMQKSLGRKIEERKKEQAFDRANSETIKKGLFNFIIVFSLGLLTVYHALERVKQRKERIKKEEERRLVLGGKEEEKEESILESSKVLAREIGKLEAKKSEKSK